MCKKFDGPKSCVNCKSWVKNRINFETALDSGEGESWYKNYIFMFFNKEIFQLLYAF